MRFLLVLLLSGCAQVPQNPTRLTVVWHEVERSDVQKVCQALLNYRYKSGPKQVVGCAYRNGDECHIVTPKVKDEGDLSIAGHELGHCKMGKFHDRDGNWK